MINKEGTGRKTRRALSLLGMITGLVGCGAQTKAVAEIKPMERDPRLVMSTQRAEKLPEGTEVNMRLAVDGNRCYGLMFLGGQAARIAGWAEKSIQAGTGKTRALEKIVCYLGDKDGNGLKLTIWLTGRVGDGNRVIPSGPYEWSQAEIPEGDGQASESLEGLGNMKSLGGNIVAYSVSGERLGIVALFKRTGE